MSDLKDLFISYAHIDDEPDVEGQAGWVSAFHRNLEVRLNKLTGERSEVWRDPSLQGNDAFAQTIEQEFRRVKALVSIMTPRYIKSDWCRRELLGFLRAAEASGGFQLGDKVRLFKILKTPILDRQVPEDLPPELLELHRNLLGYEFYDIDPQTKKPREYSKEFGPEAERLYHQKVYDVALELSDLLARFDRERGSQGAPDPEVKTVFLASCTADRKSERDQIKRELRDRGHMVLPDAELPLVGKDLRDLIRRCLEQSDLAIHLLGDFYGFIPEGDNESVVQIQNTVAAEVAKAKSLPRLIWIPKGLAPTEARQAEFIRHLEENEAAQRGAEILRGPLDLLKELMFERLKPPPKAAESAAVPASGKAPLIYLIGDKIDEQALDPIDDLLFEKGLEVTRPSFEGSESDLAEAHQRRLIQCDAALIYYGTTSRDWVDMKLMDLDQAPGYGRAKDYRARAVAVAPPEDRSKQRFRSQAVEVLRFGERFDPALLSSFIDKVVAHN